MRYVVATLTPLVLLGCDDRGPPDLDEAAPVPWALPDPCGAGDEVPHVLWTDPPRGAEGVADDILPTLLYSVPIDPLTAVDALTIEGVSGRTVVAGRRLTFVPDGPLPRGPVTVKVDPGIRTVDGRSLELTLLELSFTVRATRRVFEGWESLIERGEPYATGSGGAVPVIGPALGAAVFWSQSFADYGSEGDDPVVWDRARARQRDRDLTWDPQVDLGEGAMIIRTAEQGRIVTAQAEPSSLRSLHPCNGWGAPVPLDGTVSAVAMDPSGDALITYRTDAGIVARRFASDDTLGEPEIIDPSGGEVSDLEVAGPRAVAVVSDPQSPRVIVRDASGRWSEAHALPAAAAAMEATLDVDGNVLVVWREGTEIRSVSASDGVWAEPVSVIADASDLSLGRSSIYSDEAVLAAAAGASVRTIRWSPSAGWGAPQQVWSGSLAPSGLADTLGSMAPIGVDAEGRVTLAILGISYLLQEGNLYLVMEQAPGNPIAVDVTAIYLDEQTPPPEPGLAVSPSGEALMTVLYPDYQQSSLTVGAVR